MASCWPWAASPRWPTKMARLALLTAFQSQSTLLPLPKLRIKYEFQYEDSPFQLPDLVQRAGDLVLTRVGGQLAHDQRSGGGAVANRRWQAEDLVPVVDDQPGVD